MKYIALIMCFSLINFGCKAGEPVGPSMNKLQITRVELTQTPEWAGVDTVSVVCRINKEFGDEFVSSIKNDLDYLSEDIRTLICSLTNNVITANGFSKMKVQIKSKVDSELLEKNHAGVMMDISLEWRKEPYKGIAIAIASHLFRYNPGAPAGAFFRSQPGILLIAGNRPQDINLDANVDMFKTLIKSQMDNILQ